MSSDRQSYKRSRDHSEEKKSKRYRASEDVKTTSKSPRMTLVKKYGDAVDYKKLYMEEKMKNEYTTKRLNLTNQLVLKMFPSKSYCAERRNHFLLRVSEKEHGTYFNVKMFQINNLAEAILTVTSSRPKREEFLLLSFTDVSCVDKLREIADKINDSYPGLIPPKEVSDEDTLLIDSAIYHYTKSRLSNFDGSYKLSVWTVAICTTIFSDLFNEVLAVKTVPFVSLINMTRKTVLKINKQFTTTDCMPLEDYNAMCSLFTLSTNENFQDL